MLRIFLFILLAASLFAREYIAIIDFEGINVKDDDARALTQRLTSEMISLGVYQIVERSEMKRLLEEQKFQYSGCVDISCAVDIGKLIGAKYMVVGSVSKVGRAYSLDSRMIDVETGESYISAKYSLQGGIESLLFEGMDSIAHQLCELPFEDKKMNPIQSNKIGKNEETKTKSAKVNNKSYRRPSSNESLKFSHCFESVYFMPVYAKTEINNKGEILGTKGIGMWPGYYKKNYYKPVELNKWNSYWHWGTAFLFLPWIGIGTDFVAEDGAKRGVSSIYIFPSFSMGKYYNKIENKKRWYVSLIGFSTPDMNTGTNELSILLRYNNIQLVRGTIDQHFSTDKSILSGISGIGIHHHIKKYSKTTLSHNFIVSEINDVSSENGNQSLILVDMNFELESNKLLGFGWRSNIGFRIQENNTLIDSEAYRKLHGVIDASGLYASFSFLLLTFGS